MLGPSKPGDKPIDSIKAWEQRRAEFTGILNRILGEPTNLKPSRPEVQVVGEEVLDDHIRRHIRIRSEPDDWIPAYLLLPKKLGDKPMPTMICLHQTVAQGKDEPCGIKGNPELAFALQLVRRGFVCIAPDAIGFGERIPAGAKPYHDSISFYRKHPGWSFMGKMVWDVSRVIDCLETLPFVDPLQIGSIGHSHGGYGAIMAAAFDSRIALSIVSCGLTTLRGDPNPDRWSHLTALMPQIGLYLPDVDATPFDWHQVVAMIAPRPLFVWYATKDTIFPNTDNLDALFKDVRGVYGLYGAADDLTWQAFPGEHRFPDEGRAGAYTWLEQRFFPIGDLHKIPADLDRWNKQRDLIRRVIVRTIGRDQKPPPPFDLKLLDSESLPEYERRYVEYTVATDERVRAYLCLPRDAKRPTPGVLVLHQTIADGKQESVGLAGSATLAFGADLARRGYITLSPDSICAGERIDSCGAFDTRGHYLRYPDLSAMGKMLADARRALDLLVQADGVDPQRVGAIGHSLGAEEALMLAAFDERVRAAVASCGYATFAADPERLRWARDAWFSYMPVLRPVLQRDRVPHWDWGNVLMLIAPRALYQHTTRGDNIFPKSISAYEAGESARAVWKLYEQPDRLANVLRDGKHEVSDPARADMYDWLDKQLK
ncbi:MAG TPA: dienelactone hydrolase family protein [Phycisphaerae bacterium]|nr:dienelactone hydrolase family protein [Phycisphaerae bacterium]